MKALRKRGRAAMEDRRRILERDKYLCQACLRKGRFTAAAAVDHIVPLAKGGADTDGNKEALCTPCHDAKTHEDFGQRYSKRCTIEGIPLDPRHPWNTEK